MCHLYGNLLNTYGDVGNLMAFEYELKKRGIESIREIVSIGDNFKANDYDFVFFGGGQDYEQAIVKKDLITKKDELKNFIENDGLFLAICGGFQLLGKYYYSASGEKIEGLNIFDHYTLNQDTNDRFTGEIKIKVERFNEVCEGFENHGGRTFLAEGQKPFGKVIEGNGNNGEDGTEGFIYKNTIGTYLHGPVLARNENLCKKIIELII
ncbi:adenosylcobyric acid synthase [uncultured Anaerococcus sp.]|uniref:type 1 glutamine amidotransferase n=1 Tax=uncultured Anaerococcus sp. TaxID=293428 RepID=UPI003414B3DB